MLKGKIMPLGVTDGTACYKSAGLASALMKQGANVRVLMTRNATEFIGPHTFESLTDNRVNVDTFDHSYQFQVEHITLVDQTGLVPTAPATVNVPTRPAHGLADDMLTTTALACDCPKIAAPAMDTRMHENLVTQDSPALPRRYDWEIVEPISGHLACRAVGKGKMPEPEGPLETMLHTPSHTKDMEGLKVLVTTGPTRGALDPVRCLTDHSTGWMDYAMTRAIATHRVEVMLVSGPAALKKPVCVETVDVVSAQDMFGVVTACVPEQGIIIRAIAVADYRLAQMAQDKVRKEEGGPSIPLEHTRDILVWLGEHRRLGRFPYGFSTETRDMVKNSRRKLGKKHPDLITANNLKEPSAGFAVPTNLLALISPRGELELPLPTKGKAAHRLLDKILELH